MTVQATQRPEPEWIWLLLRASRMLALGSVCLLAGTFFWVLGRIDRLGFSFAVVLLSTVTAFVLQLMGWVALNEASRLLAREIREILSVRRAWVNGLGERMSPRGLRRSVDTNRARLEEMRQSLASLGVRGVARHRERLGSTGRRLDLLSPLATLQRGYAIAEREDGHVVAHAADVVAGDPLAVRFQDGRIHVYVNDEAPK